MDESTDSHTVLSYFQGRLHGLFIGWHQVFYVFSLVLSLQTDWSWFREQNLDPAGAWVLGHRGSGLDQDLAHAPGSGVLGEPQLAATGTPHANIMQIQTKPRTTV